MKESARALRGYTIMMSTMILEILTRASNFKDRYSAVKSALILDVVGQVGLGIGHIGPVNGVIGY